MDDTAAASQSREAEETLQSLTAALRDFEARADPADPAAAEMLAQMRELTRSLQRPLWSRPSHRRTANAPPPKSASKPDESFMWVG